MSNSHPKARPIPGNRPPAPESAAMPPSSWAKKTGFKPKFSGETNASDSGQISLPPRPKEQRDAQPDLEAGRVKATPLPVPPPAAVNGVDTVVAVPAENKDQTVVKRRRDSDGGTWGAKKDGSGHGANGAGTNGPPAGPRRAVTRNEEVIDVEDDGFAGGRHIHMKYELRDTPGLGGYFNGGVNSALCFRSHHSLAYIIWVKVAFDTRPVICLPCSSTGNNQFPGVSRTKWKCVFLCSLYVYLRYKC